MENAREIRNAFKVLVVKLERTRPLVILKK
jgi:hypothetical protein